MSQQEVTRSIAEPGLQVLASLNDARQCSELLLALGARIDSVVLSGACAHAPTICLADPGDLAAHLDVKQHAIFDISAGRSTLLHGCVVLWRERSH